MHTGVHRHLNLNLEFTMTTKHQRARTLKSTVVIEDAKPAHERKASFATFNDAETQYDRASSQRKLVAWVLGITAAIGSSYVLGSCVEALTSLAFALSGSAFLSMMVYIVGLVITVYAGMNAFASVFGYVVSDDCVRHIAMAQDKVNSAVLSVGSFFKRVAA